MSQLAFTICIVAVVLAAGSLRCLCDLTAPWSVGDDLSIPYAVCCLGATPLLAAAALGVVLASSIKAHGTLQTLVSQVAGLAIAGPFVFFTLPLLGVLATPMALDATAALGGQDCDSVRQDILRYASEAPSRYCRTTEQWLDIDGDGDDERLERINARTGGIGFGSAVFIHESDANTARWCGKVQAAEMPFSAWIRLINLDFDLTPEIWMRNASLLPRTAGFVDFSGDGARVFDPRLAILLVIIPVRVLPVVGWVVFRRKPVGTVALALLAIPTYIVMS